MCTSLSIHLCFCSMGSGVKTHSKCNTSITGCICVLNRVKENSEDEKKSDYFPK